MAYLYVLWAVEDGFVKVGSSIHRQKRQNTHSGNSSNPLEFIQWKLYKLESREDAVKLERKSQKELAKRGYQFRNKRELFKCDPVKVTEVIDLVAEREAIVFLKNYPQDTEHLLSMGLDFVDLPYYLRDSLSPTELKIYLLGASDAFHVLRYLDGKHFSAEEISCLASSVHQSGHSGIEMWREMLQTLSLLAGNDEERLKLLRHAEERIERVQKEAFNSWQDMDDEECEKAA